MNYNKKLIKTAQFAKFCNVSKQTLIYYDKMGIFHPCHVDEKGYRYYSLKQHDVFMIIAMLRELDTPLSEIRKYLENKSTDSFLELLSKKQKEVNRKIEHLKELSLMIEGRKNMTQNGMTLSDYEDVNIEYMTEERIIVSDYIINQEEVEYVKIISNLEKYIIQNRDYLLYIGVMIEKSKLLAGQFHGISRFYVKSNKNCENSVIKPKGLFAITFHKGEYETVYLSYKRIIKYIENNGYIIAGNSYEDALLDTCTQRSEKEYLTRICIQIEKVN